VVGPQAISHSTSTSFDSASEYSRSGLLTFSRVCRVSGALSTLPTSRRVVRVVIPKDGELRAGGSFPRERVARARGDNAFREVSFPFGETSSCGRSVLVCLANTIRSQSFSLSQRFNPARTLWLYFAPHPPIGFVAFRVFPTQSAFTPLDDPYSLAVKQCPSCPASRR
jgi:hypothetical protein